MKRAWLVGILIALVLAADHFTKLVFMKTSAFGGRFAIPRVLDFIQHENHGVIANLPVPQPVIVLFTVAALAVLIGLLRRSMKNGSTAQVVGLAIAIGGALGNLWDRLAWQFVFDWILLFNRSVINIADIAIAIGLLIFLLSSRKQTLPTNHIENS